MIEIQLSRGKWQYDPSVRLGKSGGFGAVFLGSGEAGGEVAVKRLHRDIGDQAHRELDIAKYLVQQELEHVMPVLDAGQDPNSNQYFIVMPRAETSLSDHLKTTGLYTQDEAIDVLQSIAEGLAEVPDIVHRDLKPANVLCHNDSWKVSDYGIARFVEASTSLRTLKGFLTPQYAAPEQWRLERTSHATDVYALGCIAYELLTGAPPFPGPSRADFRDQHLNSTPRELKDTSPRLSGLILSMLRKEPAARPSLNRVLRLLDEFASVCSDDTLGEGFEQLALAGADAAGKAIEEDAARLESARRTKTRYERAEVARQILPGIIAGLFRKIRDVAPAAEEIAGKGRESCQIRLGSASLIVQPVAGGRPISTGEFASSGWDVILGWKIEVSQEYPNHPNHFVWGANLWYTDLGQNGGYRWWEIPYMRHPLLRTQPRFQPFAVTDFRAADVAAVRGMNEFQFAAKPRPIDDEDAGDFYARWAELLSKAYYGRLRPSRLPVD